jgi:anti-sigma regulatory factor (Ser/Thr protein kinase)
MGICWLRGNPLRKVLIMDSADRTDAPGVDDDSTRASDASLYGQAGPATEDQLGPMRRSIAQWARGVGADEETVESIVLATDEALSNVVGHAYPDLTGDFELRAEYVSESGRIEITIRDHGRAKRPTEPDIHHGRGIPLIFALADQADIMPSAKGTSVRMSWRVSATGPST